MPRPPAQTRSLTIRQINRTLEGPVAEVLAQMVPELKKLPRRGVLERVLDDPALLDRCFQAFRADPGRFRDLLVDRHNVPVAQADAMLACGRSLDDVVAMVVRTCAKRQFRKRLDGESRPLRGELPRPPRPTPQASGVFGRLARLLSLAPSTQPPRRSRGEILYDAFKEHLRHDWQVALVPEYSTLSPQLVRRLGARILDYRVPEDIRRLRDNPLDPPPPSTLPDSIPAFLSDGRAVPPPPPAAVLPLPTGPAFPPPPTEPEPPRPGADRRARLQDILTADQKRLRPEAFTPLLLSPEVRAALSNPEQTVRLTGVLAEVGGLPAKMLIGELGLRPDQLVVLLLTIHDMIGDEAFRRAFGLQGNLDYVAKFVERVKTAGLGQNTSLGETAAFARRVFAAFRRPQPAAAARP